MKPWIASLFLMTLILSFSFHESTAAANSSFCDSNCGVRCSKAGLKKRCLKYCKICCTACNCVPSGTYGNKSDCPCYRDKMNSKGKPKCP